MPIIFLLQPIEIRENIEPRAQKVEALGVFDKSAETAKTLVEKAIAVESGRWETWSRNDFAYRIAITYKNQTLTVW